MRCDSRQSYFGNFPSCARTDDVLFCCCPFVQVVFNRVFIHAIIHRTEYRAELVTAAIVRAQLPGPNSVAIHTWYAYSEGELAVQNCATSASMVQDCCGAEVRASTFNDMAREFVRLVTALGDETGLVGSLPSPFGLCATIGGLLLLVLLVVCGVGGYWMVVHRRHSR